MIQKIKQNIKLKKNAYDVKRSKNRLIKKTNYY